MKMTTNFWKVLFLACFLVGKVSAQEHNTGCVLSPKLYEKVPLTMPLARGEYDVLPASHSLRKYAPTPQNQGSYGTCVGWAIAYSARTIQMAHQQNWTNTVLITENALSPFFVYESAKPSSDIHCTEGTSLYNGLEILKDLGAVKVFDYPHQCGRSISKNLENKAQNFKIKDYSRLFETGTKDKIPFVKKSIWYNDIFWTLGIEFQFYIILGLFFPILERINKNGGQRIFGFDSVDIIWYFLLVHKTVSSRNLLGSQLKQPLFNAFFPVFPTIHK